MTAIDDIIDATVRRIQASGMLQNAMCLARVVAVDQGTVTVKRGSAGSSYESTFPNVRVVGEQRPRVGDVVEICQTQGGWVCLGALATSQSPKMQSGSAVIPSPGTGGGWSGVVVTFPAVFDSVPRISITPQYDGSTASTEIETAFNNVTGTKFDCRVRRSTAYSTTVDWIATTH